MQSSQILRGMLHQPRVGLSLPTTGCSTSTRCSCSGQATCSPQRVPFAPAVLRSPKVNARRSTLRPVAASDASADLPSQPASSSSQGGLSKSNTRSLQGSAFVFAFGAAAALYLYQGGYFPVIQEYTANSPLGKSGCLAAFALIFLSEIGDKTFFIAALLAMRVGKWLSFTGSVAALSLMTVVSVGIGVVFKNVPDQFSSSIPIGQYLGIALLVYFGLKTLKFIIYIMGSRSAAGCRLFTSLGIAGKGAVPVKAEYDLVNALQEAWDTPDDAEAGGELGAAESSLSQYSDRLGGAWWQKFAEVASLIFVAEWGDRSMLATIALGAAQSPVGVATGAIFGHAIATAIAVIGGSIASQYISEKTVGYIGGVLFLVFAVATGFGYF